MGDRIVWRDDPQTPGIVVAWLGLVCAARIDSRRGQHIAVVWPRDDARRYAESFRWADTAKRWVHRQLKPGPTVEVTS